jgi:hypothetical protein
MPPKQHVKSPLRKEVRQDNSMENNNGEEVVVQDTVADSIIDADTLSDEDMMEDQDDGAGERARDAAADRRSEEVPQAFREEDQLVHQIQDAENGKGEQDDVQADVDMETNWSDKENIIDDATKSTASETAEDLLNEIKTNWGIDTLKKLMVPGINRNGNPEDTWLPGETDIADEEWEMNTLRLFRNLSRLTQSEYKQAKDALTKKLSYRKHNENGGRTGGDKSLEKEPRLRNDLREVISSFKQKKREAEDEGDNTDEEPTGPKKNKRQKRKSSASIDDDDDLYIREDEIWKKGRNRKHSSKVPGEENIGRLGLQQHDPVESSPSPNLVPPVDPREKNGEKGKNIKASSKEKAKATPKRKRNGKKDDNTDSTPSESPTITTIQNAEERDTALERINENLGTTSLLGYLPAGLYPIGVNNDAELDWGIIARMLDLSSAATTEVQRNALRQALVEQVAGRAGSSTEAICADIALAGEQYHVEEQAKINNRSSLSAPRSARQSPAESLTLRRPGLRSHNRQEVPPVTNQPAEAAQVPHTTLASEPDVSPSARDQPKLPVVAEDKATDSQTRSGAKLGRKNEGATQQLTRRTQQQGGHNLIPHDPPEPPTYPSGQQFFPQASVRLPTPPLPPAHPHIENSDAASRRRELDDTRRRFREAEAAEENFNAEVRRTQTRDENAVIRKENARRDTERRRVEMELAERAMRGDDAQVGFEHHAEPGGA